MITIETINGKQYTIIRKPFDAEWVREQLSKSFSATARHSSCRKVGSDVQPYLADVCNPLTKWTLCKKDILHVLQQGGAGGGVSSSVWGYIMTRAAFLTTSAISTVLGAVCGYRIGEDMGRAEGEERGRNQEQLRQRVLAQMEKGIER